MYSTIDVKADLSVMIPSAQIDSFKQALHADSNHTTLTDTLAALDGENAQASNPVDKEQIFHVVREHIPGGFPALNTLIKAHLRKWYAQKCLEFSLESNDSTLLFNILVAQREFVGNDPRLDVLVQSFTNLRQLVEAQNSGNTARISSNPYAAALWDSDSSDEMDDEEFDAVLEGMQQGLENVRVNLQGHAQRQLAAHG